MVQKPILILQKEADSKLLRWIAADPIADHATALLTIDSAIEATRLLDSLVFTHVILAAEGVDCEMALTVASCSPDRVAGLLLLNPPARLQSKAANIPTLLLTTADHTPPVNAQGDHFRLQESPTAHLSEIVSAFLALRVA